MSKIRFLIAGNWKMNTSPAQGIALGKEILELIPAEIEQIAEIAICIPYTHLELVRSIPGFTERIQLGAQNCHWMSEGAFTGEISASMLYDMGCTYIITGHSERRQYFGETDEHIALKTKAILGQGLRPIVCVGETLEERDSGATLAIITRQLEAILKNQDILSHTGFPQIVIAYEPVWAIGTGRAATAEQAQQVHAFIRSLLCEYAGQSIGNGIRILYGGSVNAANSREYFGCADINGALIGGASLKAQSFISIIQAAAESAKN
jgi:triosephosphate isomerase